MLAESLSLLLDTRLAPPPDGDVQSARRHRLYRRLQQLEWPRQPGRAAAIERPRMCRTPCPLYSASSPVPPSCVTPRRR